MAGPHLQSTLDAITQVLFTDGTGPHYVRQLQGQLDARPGDAQAIDSALSLGWYALHTDAHKRQRQALRAVLLANFLMKGVPVAQVEGLRSYYGSMSLDALKRQFVFLFPALDDAEGKRRAWHPALFTDPRRLRELWRPVDWRHKPVPEYRFIVHAITNAGSPVLTDPIGQLSRYDLLSMSILSTRKPWAYVNRGVILRVPQNNIIATSPADMLTQTHAVSIHERRRDPGAGLPIMAEHVAQRNAQLGGLRTPQEVVQAQHTNVAPFGIKSLYNEIAVCGRPGVPLPHGLTGRLELAGYFLAIQKNGQYLPSPDLENPAEWMGGWAASHGVPLLFLPR
jgi:hypothetical protein